MTKSIPSDDASPISQEDFIDEKSLPDTAQTRSPSFRPAYADRDFLLRDELRPMRFQLELLKPELIQQEQGIESTIVVFGSTRIPDPAVAKEDLQRAKDALDRKPDDASLRQAFETASKIHDKSTYYELAREFSRLATEQSLNGNAHSAIIVTGSGPGIMEAANRGAFEAGGKSIGLNIIIPREQYPNAYVTPELCFQFQYFALRKMHFLLRAVALVVFPGGYGTLDELFETLTLIQTKKMRPLPVLLFGKEYWERIINFEALLEEGAIDQADYELFQFVDAPEEAWSIIRSHYTQADAE